MLEKLSSMFGDDVRLTERSIFVTDGKRTGLAAKTVLQSSETLDSWWIECEDYIAPEAMKATQALYNAVGLAPPAGPFSRDRTVVTSRLWTDREQLAAACSVSMPYHDRSRFAGHALLGTAAVDPAHAKRGLARLVRAHVLLESQSRLRWKRCLATVDAQDASAHKTIIAAGFLQEPDIVTIGVAKQG